MNDSTHNNEQQTNQAFSPNSKIQGLVRSPSSSSSSSFDSCSDLLGSLENAEETPDDPLKQSQTDLKETEPCSEAKDDVKCHQPSSVSQDVLDSTTPKQCEPITHEQLNSSLLHSEVKVETGKLESTTVKDHVYGLSNAISFSMVRSLAENTVERISQFPSPFRLPTSYMFPLKNVLQSNNTPLPTGSNAQMDAGSDVSRFCKDHSVGKEPYLGEVVDDKLNDDRNIQKLGASSGLYGEDDSSKTAKATTDMTASRTDEVRIINVSAGNTARLEEEQLVSSSQSSKRSEQDMAATNEGLQYLNKIGPENGSDSQLSESSVMLSDVQKRNSAFCHPLRTLSSGSGRPDLEDVDDEQNLSSGTKKSLGWDSSTAERRRLLPKVDTMPTSVSTLVNAEANIQANNEAYVPEGMCWDHERYNQSSSHFQQTAFLQNVAPSACKNQGRELTWSDQPTLTEALEGLKSDGRGSLALEKQSFGEILHEERWKSLNIQLENIQQFDERGQKDSLGPDELCRYVGNLELNEAYVDTVLDMEDVLLNGDENGSRERFWLASSSSVIGTPRSSRDGSLSSSTSGLNLLTLGESTLFAVDWVEVVGAKQKRGGSSFGERIVGVKDHTVYCIKVSSGNQEWEVLRRYRDFVDLYHQLRRKFNVRTEKPLPSPWWEVDRDSRKVFGNTHPNVVEVRSSRIEKCLQSLLQAGPPFSTSSPLIWFLCPQSSVKGLSWHGSHHLTTSALLQKGRDVQLGSIESPYLQSPRSEVGSLKNELDHKKGFVSLGKTVKLNLKTHPNKNLKQLLSSQHYSCAGCYKHLETDRGLVYGFVQTLGWGKPRLCEYSGQLYCTSCHLNETAVLPAQVLWHWDFTPRGVSQLAKAYLDSIYDQPMLCVSAVNPYLYSRVPILSHVKETRRKLSKMLACMLCPHRMRILQTMASRRYLLENNDFFALRDLEDLSKGAFAVLPSLLKAVLEKLRLHITKQCSVCWETGEWCGAEVLCEEPFSPIFPFEEENVTSCKVCHAVFHKGCFSRFASCPACAEDGNKDSWLAGALEKPQTEGVGEACRDDTLILGGEDVSASPPIADLQGGFELDKQSQMPKNWPSFYSLLPKKRLW